MPTHGTSGIAHFDSQKDFHDVFDSSHDANGSESEHFVQFYETDEFLLDSLSRFISTGLDAGDACIVVATEAHRDSLEERLTANGLDLAAALARDEYIALDAGETLGQFMVDGSPEAERFAVVVGGIIERAAKGQRSVRIFGEMVALLWANGNRAAATRLEGLWNELVETHSFSLFCAYPMKSFTGEANGVQLSEICSQHSHVIPDESFTLLSSADERLRAITLLQQKANSLEGEIAERRAVEERLRVSEARLQMLETLKEEFINLASHELKTPITSLKGFTHLLQRRLSSEGDAPTRLYLERMEVQLTKMTKLISDMLDLSRTQTGKLTYQQELVDLDALVHDVVEQVQVTTPTHHLQCVGNSYAQVYGDRDRLAQVFINLLSNAVRYSPRVDTVLITLALDGEQALVSIRDFGIGIDEAHHERIFERFYRVPGALEQTFPGLGIGLYLSREIVLRHQGRLWVESRKGQGSTFFVSLPAHM